MVVMNGMDLEIWIGHWDGGFGGLWTLHSIACVLDDLGMMQQHSFLEMLACSHECYFLSRQTPTTASSVYIVIRLGTQRLLF